MKRSLAAILVVALSGCRVFQQMARSAFLDLVAGFEGDLTLISDFKLADIRKR